MTIEEAVNYLEAGMPYHMVGVQMGLENGKVWEAVKVMLDYLKNQKTV